MLCPNCGKDVGDKPRLCEDCEAARKPAAPPEDAAEPTAPSEEEVQPENLPAINRTKPATGKPSDSPKARTADEKKSAVPIIIAFGSILLLGSAAFFLFSSDSPKEPAATPSSQTPPGATPLASGTPSGASPAGTSGKSGSTGATGPAATASVSSAEVQLTNAQWKNSFALFDKSKHEVTFAFYAELLSDGEKEALRTQGTFPNKGTRLLETFLLEPNATEFSAATIRAVKAVYFGPETEQRPVGFSYVVAKKDLPVAAKLSGKLEESSLLEGTSKQTGEKTLENGQHLKLSWDLVLKAQLSVLPEKASMGASGQQNVAPPIPAPTAESTPAASKTASENSSTDTPSTTASESPSGEETGAPATPIPNIREGELGVIIADNNALSIKEAFALYYPETGAVSIGLFGQELDDQDRAAILKKRVVTSMVNGKRPSMVLSLDFSKKNGEINRQTLTGYTAYFYRDSSGLFFFPGGYDSKSVRRSTGELEKSEFTSLSGQLKDGETLILRTYADNKPEKGFTKLEWNLALKVKLNAVQ